MSDAQVLVLNALGDGRLPVTGEVDADFDRGEVLISMSRRTVLASPFAACGEWMCSARNGGARMREGSDPSMRSAEVLDTGSDWAHA